MGRITDEALAWRNRATDLEALLAAERAKVAEAMALLESIGDALASGSNGTVEDLISVEARALLAKWKKEKVAANAEERATAAEARAERAEAAAGQLREALMLVLERLDVDGLHDDTCTHGDPCSCPGLKQFDAALASDCGAGYVSPAEHAKVLAEAAAMREALNVYAYERQSEGEVMADDARRGGETGYEDLHRARAALASDAGTALLARHAEELRQAHAEREQWKARSIDASDYAASHYIAREQALAAKVATLEAEAVAQQEQARAQLAGIDLVALTSTSKEHPHVHEQGAAMTDKEVAVRQMAVAIEAEGMARDLTVAAEKMRQGDALGAAHRIQEVVDKLAMTQPDAEKLTKVQRKRGKWLDPLSKEQR